MRSLFLLFSLLIVLQGQSQRYSVVIHEIFADPTPSVGLPATEWIEIRNRSPYPLQLQGWRIGDAVGQSGPISNITLYPDSLLILCSVSSVNSLGVYGRCVGLSSFPSLDNEGDRLILRNAVGQIIHAIEYADNWHTNALKKEGGWSLEMIDPAQPGLFKPNWASSIQPAGGTPGQPNSISGTQIDNDAPILLKGFALDSIRLLVLFDEALDSAAISQEGLFHLSDNREIVEARCLPPLYDRVELRADRPLLQQQVYTLTNIEAADLNNNLSTTNQSIRIGIPSPPDTTDIRINEILFDPPTGGSDYVELINKGKKIIDLSRIYLTSRSATGNLGSIVRVTPSPIYFFPGDHLVLTADPFSVERNYFVEKPEWILETAALPSLPDAAGSLVVLNNQGIVMDELRYEANWHSPRLQTRMGVALERIDPNTETQNRNNWQSAASTVGFGTPTRRNSQYRSFINAREIELSAKVFSPDGDGIDDILQIRIQSTETAEQVRIRIFHSSGVLVREVANGALLGTNTVINWDGQNDRGHPVAEGQYIILTEIAGQKEGPIRKKNLIAQVRSEGG